MPSGRALSIGCPATEPEHAESWEKPRSPNKLPRPVRRRFKTLCEASVTHACTKNFPAPASSSLETRILWDHDICLRQNHLVLALQARNNLFSRSIKQSHPGLLAEPDGVRNHDLKKILLAAGFH